MFESGGWGGLAHYGWNLCQALAGAGARVTLLTGRPYELDALPRQFEVLAPLPPASAYRERVASIRRTVESVDPDLLHLQSTVSARRDWWWLGRLRRRGRRVVTTAHNVLPHDAAERDAPGMRWAFGRIYGLSDRIIVHGAEVRRDLLDRFPRVDARRVEVIPHGDYGFVATGRLPPAADARAALGLDPGRRLVLSFGAIREYKGIPDLIDAFARVAGDLPDVDLAVVGKPLGVDPVALVEQAAAAGLEDRVLVQARYVPFEEIGTWFAACDLAVYPYRAIYQSGAVQLAYGCGRPVVVTRVGALPETVRDGVNGRIVPPADPRALAAAVLELMELAPEELQAMGTRSRELAGERHGWDDIATRTLALYARVLDGSTP